MQVGLWEHTGETPRLSYKLLPAQGAVKMRITSLKPYAFCGWPIPHELLPAAAEMFFLAGCEGADLPLSGIFVAIEPSVVPLDIIRKSHAFDQFFVWYGSPGFHLQR